MDEGKQSNRDLGFFDLARNTTQNSLCRLMVLSPSLLHDRTYSPLPFSSFLSGFAHKDNGELIKNLNIFTT
ncbi:hypothetical protein CJ030_MR5G003245 [Morella rubra]|uniref:Uncharacterized protein n=1 Tax=Morella rubra TaxID=262757 RepID=A0A6A1VP36_9ROSI|nr:hypothetical protein CJ030_MR5G003245 [Morella rubra]